MQVYLYVCGVGGKPDYIAYKGDEYQIEFFYNEKGKSQSRDYTAEQLSLSDIKKFAKLLEMMGDSGKIRNKEKFRNEGDKIFAFKPQPHRFFVFSSRVKK